MVTVVWLIHDSGVSDITGVRDQPGIQLFLLESKRHFSPFECGVIVKNEMLSMRELLE